MSVKERRLSEKTRSQVAALCFKPSIKNKIEILLITSRKSKKWLIPKGWPIGGLKAHKAAEQEALEEAGAIGDILDLCVGKYSYIKKTNKKLITCDVSVYPLNVTELMKDYKERRERARAWVSREEAIDNVFEPGLKRILKSFDPKILIDLKLK